MSTARARKIVTTVSTPLEDTGSKCDHTHGKCQNGCKSDEAAPKGTSSLLHGFTCLSTDDARGKVYNLLSPSFPHAAGPHGLGNPIRKIKERTH